MAELAWLESVKKKPNFIAYRNLARLEHDRGKDEKAEHYYGLALKCEGAYADFALCAEYFEILLSAKKYDLLWQHFTSLPENCKSADRIRIHAASAAVKTDKLDYLEEFFSEEHYDIREGENSLTDIWFEFVARRLARERCIEPTTDNLNKLLDEAEESYPPDPRIDFRMSLDKAQQYRVR